MVRLSSNSLSARGRPLCCHSQINKAIYWLRYFVAGSRSALSGSIFSICGRLSLMLSKNIKAIRKSKGLSQQELAIKLNVVRQTVSKWEQGLSVPDSDMLISLSEVLETPVSTLLGETVIEAEADNLKAISEKLEVINLQLAQRKTAGRKIVRWLLISLCVIIVMVFAALAILNSPYLAWDYSDPETAVLGVAFHSLEWLFVRVAPIIFIAAIIGIFFTFKRK